MDKTNEHATVDGREPMGVQYYTKSSRQLRKARTGKAGSPHGRVSLGCPVQNSQL